MKTHEKFPACQVSCTAGCIVVVIIAALAVISYYTPKMEGLSTLVKSTLPNYLSNLPIPNSFTGWFKLGFKDWLQLVPPTACVAGIGYMSYLAFCPKGRPTPSARCNNKIRLDEAKVVDMIDVEDIAEKAAFCRCWKSKNWPYCDGAHGEHNKTTGDNAGPVVVKRKGA